MPYDFSFTISGPTHVVTGKTLYIYLNLALLDGTRDYVTFTVEDLPSGAVASTPDLEVTCCGPFYAYSPDPTTLKIATATAAAGTYLINVVAVSGGVTKEAEWTLHIDAVPAELTLEPMPPFVAIPSLSTWESNMLSYGATHCANLEGEVLSPEEKLTAVYYDGMRVFQQIGAYTEDPSWADCVTAAEVVFRDGYVIPNGGFVPGYQNFTAGLRRDFELNGDAVSKDAVIDLSEQSATAKSAVLTALISPNYSREVCYSIQSYIDAEKVGNPRNSRLIPWVDILLGHFDQWFVSQNYRAPANVDPSAAANKYYIQPFMVGIAAEALIQYYREIEHDPRIPVALKTAADWMWTHAWDDATDAFWYENYIDDPNDIPAGYWTPPGATTPDLNMLIAPMYMWLFKQTHNLADRERGDQIFAGGAAGAWLSGGKQFNQNYRWSFDFVKWRNIGSQPWSIAPWSLAV